ALLLTTTSVFAQNLGHKLPGLLGLDAGRIPDPGLYLAYRIADYEAVELRDGNGDPIPTAPFSLIGRSHVFGVSYTTILPGISLYLMLTGSGPIAQAKLTVQDRPEFVLDRFGLADPYIQPFKLGWRKRRFDLVTSYGIYLPTGRSSLAGGKGISS